MACGRCLSISTSSRPNFANSKLGLILYTELCVTGQDKLFIPIVAGIEMQMYFLPYCAHPYSAQRICGTVYLLNRIVSMSNTIRFFNEHGNNAVDGQHTSDEWSQFHESHTTHTRTIYRGSGSSAILVVFGLQKFPAASQIDRLKKNLQVEWKMNLESRWHNGTRHWKTFYLCTDFIFSSTGRERKDVYIHARACTHMGQITAISKYICCLHHSNSNYIGPTILLAASQNKKLSKINFPPPTYDMNVKNKFLPSIHPIQTYGSCRTYAWPFEKMSSLPLLTASVYSTIFVSQCRQPLVQLKYKILELSTQRTTSQSSNAFSLWTIFVIWIHSFGESAVCGKKQFVWCHPTKKWFSISSTDVRRKGAYVRK